MALYPQAAPAPDERADGLCRCARVASVTLLALALLFLVSEGLPSAYSLQTQPVETACFLFMLLGLAAACRYPLAGGATVLLAWAGFVAATHDRQPLIVALFLAVALLDVWSGWTRRRLPARA